MPFTQREQTDNTNTQRRPDKETDGTADILVESKPVDNFVSPVNTTQKQVNRGNMETQPVNLKLCLYGGKEATVERSFDRETTLDEIQQEMRKVFDISSDRETKLWINSSVYAFKPTSTEAASKSNQSDELMSDVKENDNSTTNAINMYKKLLANSTSTSPIKPPPTPPPMPASNSPTSATTTTVSTTISSSNSQNNTTTSQSKANTITNSTSVTSPTVITRQAAHTMSLLNPIALPDSTSSSSIDQANKSHQTLSEAGVTDSAVVTLEVINYDGTWPSSRPRYGAITTRSSKAQPGLCGLSNMGNTCFMNAALQCLSNSPPLTEYILTDKFVEDINTNNPLGMHGEIARTYAELIKVIWSGNYGSYLPREFKCAVSRFAPQFTGFAQQDCQELMAFLLDGLHEDLNRIKNKPYIEVKDNIERRPDEEVAKESWENYKKRNDSIVVDTFHAMLKSTLVCPECKLVSVTFDPFCYLSLPLPVKREKQVNLTFLPAPAKLDHSKIKTALEVLDQEDVKILLQYGARISSFDGSIEEHAGYLTQASSPKCCKMQIPRAGPTTELCVLVARIINEERGISSSSSDRVRADNLVVAELANGKIQKIYESSEHYNQISDDIVVVEKATQYVVPLYLKDRGFYEAPPKLFFLHVPDLKYDTLYKSIITSLSNLTTESKDEIKSWHKFSPPDNPYEPVEESMECDDVDNNEADFKAATITDGDDETTESRPLKQTNGKPEVASSSSSPLDAPSSSSSGGKYESIPSENRPAIHITTCNSFGHHTFEVLSALKRECDDSSKLYLGVYFADGIAATPQFDLEPSNCVETFTPKLSQKPTLQLKDCITQFTNAERLGADDPWYCPKCKKHQQAIKKFDVWSLPKVLIIHLKRFSFSRSWRDKIDTLVEFPVEGLDMSNYVHNPEQKKPDKPMMYNLIGVANHFGGLGGGHYTAYAKNAPLNAWYSFDDALVTQTNASDVVTRSAYVLFYQLQE